MNAPTEREAAHRKIAALEAEIEEYSALPLAERAQSHHREAEDAKLKQTPRATPKPPT
jgi:hypothetical protein